MNDPERDALIARYMHNGFCRNIEEAGAAADRFLASGRRRAAKALKGRGKAHKALQNKLTTHAQPTTVFYTDVPPVISLYEQEQELLIAAQYHKSKNDTLEQQNAALKEKVKILEKIAEDDTKSVAAAAKTTCCICIVHAACYICVPCGHMCLCGACLVKHGDAPCPMCRKTVTQIIKVFTV